MNNYLKKEWPFLLILLITFIVAIMVYPYMPDQVPIHWNVKGQVDNYGSKLFGTFFLPVLNIIMYVMLIVMPKIDPKQANYIVMGNIMGRVKHNYFVGFRFPWTLANEEVWRKTHLVGAKAMVLGGFGSLIGVVFTTGVISFMILMIGIFLPMILVTIYSYVLYKRVVK